MRGSAALAALALIVASPALAESNFEKAQAAETAWEQCVVSAARRMAGRAAAETVAEAAFGRCEAEEGEFRRRLYNWSKPGGILPGLPPDELQRQIDVQRQRIRSLALGAILDSGL